MSISTLFVLIVFGACLLLLILLLMGAFPSRRRPEPLERLAAAPVGWSDAADAASEGWNAGTYGPGPFGAPDACHSTGDFGGGDCGGGDGGGGVH